MNRKQFYEKYRQARFLLSERPPYATKIKVDFFGVGNFLHRIAIDSLHESIGYAIRNKYANTHYPISDNKWAIKNNSKF